MKKDSLEQRALKTALGLSRSILGNLFALRNLAHSHVDVYEVMERGVRSKKILAVYEEDKEHWTSFEERCKKLSGSAELAVTGLQQGSAAAFIALVRELKVARREAVRLGPVIQSQIPELRVTILVEYLAAVETRRSRRAAN